MTKVLVVSVRKDKVCEGLWPSRRGHTSDAARRKGERFCSVIFYQLDFQMNTKISKLALAMGALVMAGGAMAADVTATSSAKVIKPISIAQDTGLEFGSFSTSAAAQTVIVSTAGAASGTALRSVTTGTPTAAGAFTVTGEVAYTFALTMPGTDTVTLTGGTAAPTETMGLSAFLVAPVASYDALPGTAPNYTSKLDATTGLHKFTVGATLTTVASQVAGAYTGDYTVTVAYN